MDETIDHLYEKIKDLKTKKEFKKEIKKILKDSDELFDEDTAALLIVDKLGRNNKSVTKIKDIEDKKECTILGKITKIKQQRNYTTKKGSNGRVINLEISDETGSCNLVLWNRDVDLIKEDKIKNGSIVKIINGYVKNGYNGLEVNIGKYGLIETKEDKEIKVKETKNFIEGKLVNIESTRPFFRDNGEYGFVSNIKILHENKEKRITIWDKKVKEIQKFKVGDKIKIENIDIKNRNGNKEIHVNHNCEIKKI